MTYKVLKYAAPLWTYLSYTANGLFVAHGANYWLVPGTALE